jgi:hypothetical protein
MRPVATIIMMISLSLAVSCSSDDEDRYFNQPVNVQQTWEVAPTPTTSEPPGLPTTSIVTTTPKSTTTEPGSPGRIEGPIGDWLDESGWVGERIEDDLWWVADHIIIGDPNDVLVSCQDLLASVTIGINDTPSIPDRAIDELWVSALENLYNGASACIDWATNFDADLQEVIAGYFQTGGDEIIMVRELLTNRP